jgi:hypothetical protein
MPGTKMVKEGFGVAGGAIDIGAASHVLAACSEEFAAAFSPCFANDTGRFPRSIPLHWIGRIPRKSSAFSRRRWPRRPLPHRLDQAGFLASAILVSGPGNNFLDWFPRETTMLS